MVHTINMSLSQVADEVKLLNRCKNQLTLTSDERETYHLLLVFIIKIKYLSKKRGLSEELSNTLWYTIL